MYPLSSRFFALLLPLLALVAGCSGNSHRQLADSASEASSPEAPSQEELAMAWADSCVNSMSLQLKVGQLFMPAVYATDDALTLERIADYSERLGVGGIVLLKGDVVSAAGIADSVSKWAPVPLFVSVDAETGLKMRFRDAPGFLWNSEIPADADPDALYAYGREVARESRLAGVNMILGPVLDVAVSSSQFRSFGKDAGVVARLGVAYARGLEEGGVLSVAKHFPGHGAASADSHRSLAVVTKSLDELRASDLIPFSEYVKAGLSGVMVGHIHAHALDSVKRPASFSETIIRDLLRGEMGFRGLVITDALNMGGAGGYTSADAIRAGADIVIAPPMTERAIADVVDAVEGGKLPESVIDDRCRRILFYKYILGLPAKSKPAGDAGDLSRRMHEGSDSVRARLQKGARPSSL